jgi:hypothetical protein
MTEVSEMNWVGKHPFLTIGLATGFGFMLRGGYKIRWSRQLQPTIRTWGPKTYVYKEFKGGRSQGREVLRAIPEALKDVKCIKRLSI